MDTSTSIDHVVDLKTVKVIDLERSDFPENQELANKLAETILGLAASLKRNLKYVANPLPISRKGDPNNAENWHATCSYRILPIVVREEGLSLILDQNGVFITAELCLECKKNWKHLHFRNASRYAFKNSSVKVDPQTDEVTRVEGEEKTWEYFPVSTILQTLEEAEVQARAKREEHLANIKRVEDKLRQINEIVNS